MAFRMGWCAPSVTAPSVVMRTSNGPITAQHPDGEAAASVAAASAAETDRQHAAVGVSLPYVKALLLAECSICSSIAGPRTRRDVRATINGFQGSETYIPPARRALPLSRALLSRQKTGRPSAFSRRAAAQHAAAEHLCRDTVLTERLHPRQFEPLASKWQGWRRFCS